MRIVPLTVTGAAVAKSERLGDARGYFARLFCQEELREWNHGRPIQQINLSFTKSAGSIRGLHFQHPPKTEDKAVRCLRGSVFDVILDLRRDSPTFMQWSAVELSSVALNMVYVPRGCAHGFQTLEPECEMLYLHTEFYNPEYEGGFRFDSPCLGIRWPRPVGEVSPRDLALPILTSRYPGVTP